MAAQLIDGNALSALMRQQVSDEVKALQARGVQAGLAVILVGDNPASQVYVRNKIKACEENGIHSVFEKYDASLTEAELLAAAKLLLVHPGQKEITPRAAAGTFRFWVENGMLVKYEVKLEGKLYTVGEKTQRVYAVTDKGDVPVVGDLDLINRVLEKLGGVAHSD